MKSSEYRLRVMVASMFGSIFQNEIGAYWYIRNKNSGDLVTPVLLKKYGFTPVHCYPKEATLVSCGSLMERIPEDFSGFILGTGFIDGNTVKSLRKARILAVRGELTRDKLGAARDTVLGDPGLLVSRFLRKRQKKQYTLGVVPHYADKNDVRIHRFCKRYGKEILFIDIQEDPLTVLGEIDKCDFILSSSLHGLVFADSLCIPNIWMILSDHVMGMGFKFHDYYSAIKKTQNPILISGDETLSDVIAQGSTPSSSILEEVKDKLDRVYRLLRMEVLHR